MRKIQEAQYKKEQLEASQSMKESKKREEEKIRAELERKMTVFERKIQL